jgi:hypothetical protein
MNDIILINSDNLSGIKTIYVTERDNILTWPKSIGNIYSGDIALRSGRRWYKIEYTWDSASFQEKKIKTQQGAVYEKICKGFIPRDTGGIRSALNALDGKELVVMFTDHNGKVKVAGQHSSLSFSYDYDTQRLEGDRHGYIFEIQGRGVAPAILYPNAYTHPDPQPGDDMEVYNPTVESKLYVAMIVGDNVWTTQQITHNLGSMNIIVVSYEVNLIHNTLQLVDVGVKVINSVSLEVVFSTPPEVGRTFKIIIVSNS